MSRTDSAFLRDPLSRPPSRISVAAVADAAVGAVLVPTTSAPPAPADRKDINPGIDASEPRPVEVDYINYRGERGTRRILPNRIIYGATEYHPRHQWLLEAWDLDKGAMRVFALEDMRFLDGDHPGSVASASGDQTPWSCDMAAAPADEEVEVGAGRMTFLAKLVPNGSLTMGGKPCDQWQATREGEHPPCWSDGCCWASNEDEDASLLPDRWRRVAPPLASQTEGERP